MTSLSPSAQDFPSVGSDSPRSRELSGPRQNRRVDAPSRHLSWWEQEGRGTMRTAKGTVTRQGGVTGGMTFLCHTETLEQTPISLQWCVSVLALCWHPEEWGMALNPPMPGVQPQRLCPVFVSSVSEGHKLSGLKQQEVILL